MESINPYQSPQEKPGRQPDQALQPKKQMDLNPKTGSCFLAFLWSILGTILGIFVGISTGIVLSHITAERLRAEHPGEPLCGMFVLGYIMLGFLGGAFFGGLSGALLYALTVYRKRKYYRELLSQENHE
jgi:hypothetical protein